MTPRHPVRNRQSITRCRSPQLRETTPRKPADVVYDTELKMRAERLPHEPHRAYEAFKTFLLLAECRLKNVAEKFGVSHSFS
jgi:hypothetical protein